MEYGYYSYKLNKVFKTQEELQAAEGEIVAKEQKELKIKEEREKAAKEIEDLFKQREELQAEIDKKLSEFIDKYKTYHYTLRSTYNPAKHMIDTFFKFL
jgi:chromosome segregation ATPase